MRVEVREEVVVVVVFGFVGIHGRKGKERLGGKVVSEMKSGLFV